MGRKFKVISYNITGKSNKVFRYGKIVDEANLVPGSIDKFLKDNHIEPYGEKPEATEPVDPEKVTTPPVDPAKAETELVEEPVNSEAVVHEGEEETTETPAVETAKEGKATVHGEEEDDGKATDVPTIDDLTTNKLKKLLEKAKIDVPSQKEEGKTYKETLYALYVDYLSKQA